MLKKLAVAATSMVWLGCMGSGCMGTGAAFAQSGDGTDAAPGSGAAAGSGAGPARNLTPQQRQRLQQFIQRRRMQRAGTGLGAGAGLGAGVGASKGAGLGAGGAGRKQMAVVDPDKVDARFNIAYGDADRQKLDVYIPKKLTSPAPLLIFVHGGGWQRGSKDLQREKGISYAENGVVTICTNYRLAPGVMHPKQVEDVAAAVAWAKKHATELGADPNRIFIMGHSAGAQLVDLLGTNERFLKEQGMSLADIKGVISLDTASLNLGERVKEGSVEGLMVGDMITQAFGTNPKVLADASPTLCIQRGKKYPPFLMYCGERRVSCVAQHRSFETAMNKAGSDGKVTIRPVPLNHGDISKYAGTTTTPMFKEILQFVLATAAPTTTP